MAADDDDKTIFGGPLPIPPKRPASTSPFDTPGQRPTQSEGTQVGGALPQGGRVAPASGGMGARPADNTWMTGGGGQPPQSPGIGQRHAPQDGFFPQVQGNAPVEQPFQGPKIALADALRATGLGKGGSSNPLVAAAANLLILFGRLRTGLVEMQAVPLMDHVTRELEAYAPNAVSAGADPVEAEIAKYALSGTADDIVQNLPGTDRSVWSQYSMVARFFGKRDSGVGFFQEAEKAMQAPAQRYQLLELMLMCLSLGFEGQYRTMSGGGVELGRIRAAIYESLRRVKPRPDDDIAVNWTPVLLGGKRRFGRTPFWVWAALAAVVVVAVFATLSTLLTRDGGQVVAQINGLHPVKSVTLERSGLAYEPPVPDSTQLDRIRAGLTDEITNGSVDVGIKGDYIYVRVGNLLLFESGQANVKSGFEDVAAKITEVLNAEGGPIRILGFTDDIQPSGRGRYKTNQELSEARASGVRDVLAANLTDPTRIQIEGRGEADPIADNTTPEGRAENRRVEVLIAREETL